MKTFLILLFYVALIILGPFLTLWMLNTLFPALAIAYSLKTWAAAFLLNLMLSTAGSGYRRD